jgi:hypothetical protein
MARNPPRTAVTCLAAAVINSIQIAIILGLALPWLASVEEY